MEKYNHKAIHEKFTDKNSYNKLDVKETDCCKIKGVQNPTIHQQKEGYRFIVSPHIDLAIIKFLKDKHLKCLVWIGDTDKVKNELGEKTDNRPEFLRISFYENNERIEIKVVVDFEEKDCKNKIHLNYEEKSKKNMKKYNLKWLKRLDHFEVSIDINENEKTKTVNFEKTLISFLKDFFEQSHLQFDEYEIDINNNGLYDEINLICKTYRLNENKQEKRSSRRA